VELINDNVFVFKNKKLFSSNTYLLFFLCIYLPSSFPDTVSLQSVKMVEGSNGSVGGEILKRFDVLFDYSNKTMYLKKNSNFDAPFNYNMSGMEIQHDGVEWVKEATQLKTKFVSTKTSLLESQSSTVKYNIVLKPIYKVSTIRANSPAALAGVIEGDIILRINGIDAYKYRLDEIKNLMHTEEDKWITLEIKRTGYVFKTRFQLKKIL